MDMLATYDLLAAFYASDTLPSPLRHRYQDHDHVRGVDVGGGGVARKNRVYLGNPRASHSAAKHNAAAHLFLSHAQASQLTFLALL